jgi:peptidoglycan/LPS O-acetylase OafA/YrhL
MGYRRDIDGLRAIAVLSVILFHFAAGLLPGGYLGVDIFFVLSGYLITRIIHGEILAGRFTLSGFYERRVRRILPALLVLLSVCALVAVLVLLPTDLIRFSKGLLATLAFVANLFAWRDSNYFSPLADQKPLLHTWSLGVEEQFYILFPLILFLLVRRWSRLTLPIVIAATVVSLLLHAWMLGAHAQAAFYLLPTRAWELGVGAIVALSPVRAEPGPATLARNLAAIIGLGLIAAGLLLPAEIRPAVLGALLVGAGTALLIRTGQQGDNPVARLLGMAPLVWIGLISYSLYLWHWPLIVFSRYYIVRDLRPVEIAALWLAMFVAAWISWRYVERPFRQRGFPRRTLYLGSAAGTAVLAVAAIALLQTRGLPGRLSPEAAVISEAVESHFQCAYHDRVRLAATHGCALNLPSGDPAEARLVVFGNSHAQMYAPAWRTLLEQRGEAGLLVSMIGCLPTVSANFDLGCARVARENLDAIDRLPNVRTVVLGLIWLSDIDTLVDPTGKRLDNRDMRALYAALDDVIRHLNTRGKRVVLIGPIALPLWQVASVVSRELAYGRIVDRPLTRSREDFLKEYAGVISHFSGRRDVTLARPDLVQCDQQLCHYLLDGRSLFSDANHLASAETGRFLDVFAATLQP